MVKELLEDIYLMEIPLPDSPLKNLNCYLIKGSGRNLLIDTGFNRKECYDALLADVREIGADMNKTDVFLTHHHADHSGSCQRIASRDSHIFISEPDKSNLLKMHDGTIMKSMRQTLWTYGLPDDILERNVRDNPSILYRPEGGIDYTVVGEGTVLDLVRYQLEVIHTPGHTPGHCCLYDKKRGLLFSGDHIIFGITPNITAWAEVKDSLGEYLNSLRKIHDLEVAMTFSAHRESAGDCKKRIVELLSHHDKRLRETLEIVKRYPNSHAYTVASHMKWSIRANSWEE